MNANELKSKLGQIGSYIVAIVGLILYVLGIILVVDIITFGLVVISLLILQGLGVAATTLNIYLAMGGVALTIAMLYKPVVKLYNKSVSFLAEQWYLHNQPVTA